MERVKKNVLDEKIELEVENGIIIKISKGTGGEITIKVMKNGYSTNYVNPPIPEGYKHVCGKWNDGFVIQKLSDGSQFVWIPVGSLDSDGTLDGESFLEKFGRRNYREGDDVFSCKHFHENLNQELSEQLESVKKYGGFYISRYNISKSSTGKPQSVKGAIPWVDISFDDAKKIALTFENNEKVKSDLPYGAAQDSILKWACETGSMTFTEIVMDSTNLGNYTNEKKSPGEIAVTGSREKWCVNKIYDLTGNVNEWTQEQHGNSCRVIRGGDYRVPADICPAAFRDYDKPCYGSSYTGFRIAIYIK